MQPKYSKYCYMGSKYKHKHQGICMYLYGSMMEDYLVVCPLACIDLVCTKQTTERVP